MKLLDGSELSGYIKERQAHEVRALRQASKIFPRLAIIRTGTVPAIDRYLTGLQAYATDILINTDVYDIDVAEMPVSIGELNADPEVHGIIVQVSPVTDELLNAVAADKDVGGLTSDTSFDPPAVLAISWLLAGYNIEPRGKRILILGRNRQIAKPLAALWQASEFDVTVIDEDADDVPAQTREAEIIVCATGKAGILTAGMVKPEAVIIEASPGDVAPEVREMPAITITLEGDGIEPLAICALFDNLLRAARQTAPATLL